MGVSRTTYVITKMLNGKYRFECQSPGCWVWSDHADRQDALRAQANHKRTQTHTYLRKLQQVQRQGSAPR